MQVYDTVNRLAKELKEAEEYINYKMAKQAIGINPDLQKQISEFEMARYDAQISAMQTGKEDAEKMKKVQELYSALIEKEEARKYFDAELKFNVLLGDVNKIISEAVMEVMK